MQPYNLLTQVFGCLVTILLCTPKKGKRLFFHFGDCGGWIRRTIPRQVKLRRLFSFLCFDTLTEFEVRKESYVTRFSPQRNGSSAKIRDREDNIRRMFIIYLYYMPNAFGNDLHSGRTASNLSRQHVLIHFKFYLL